jgi:hypothetical protein
MKKLEVRIKRVKRIVMKKCLGESKKEKHRLYNFRREEKTKKERTNFYSLHAASTER